MTKVLKILSLEDCDDDAMLIDRELKNGGLLFDLRFVRNKRGFESALKEYEPDVILCDHSLPQYNSIEAFQVFKEHQKATGILIPFILVTGNVSEEFAVQTIKSGVDDYIIKDRLKRLPLAIESALAKCKIERERLAYLQQVIAKEALMNEAEQLGHFGSWEVDVLAEKHTWSDATFAIYGFRPGEIEPAFPTFLKLVHPEDLEFVKATIAQTLESKDEAEYEFRIIDNHGNLKYLNCKVNVHRDADGRPVRVIGFNLDISERAKAAMALKRSEQEFRSLFQENPDKIFSLDLVGKFTNVNNAFIDMVGYSRDEMVGRDYREILTKSALAKVYDRFVSKLERKSLQYETSFTNTSGRTFLLEVTLMAIVVDDRIVGAHCVAKDVTERGKLNGLVRSKKV